MTLITNGTKQTDRFLSPIIDVNDWQSSTEFLEYLDTMWGTHTVDRFANMNNNKTKLFNSFHLNPGTLGVDAFSSNWQSDMNWLVAAVALTARAIMLLVKCKRRGTIVVPK